VALVDFQSSENQSGYAAYSQSATRPLQGRFLISGQEKDLAFDVFRVTINFAR
jgi:hypothetical protein